MKLEITTKLIEMLRPKNREHFVWDATVVGFGVRVQPTGHKSYVISFRDGYGRASKTRRLTLCAVSAISLSEARRRAKAKLAEAAIGMDPSAAKREQRQRLSFAVSFDLFLAEHVASRCKPKTRTEYMKTYKSHLANTLGPLRLHSIQKADVIRLHQSLSHSPYAANRCLALIRAIFNWLIKTDRLTGCSNPTVGIQLYPEQGRERFLSDQEGQLLLQTIDACNSSGELAEDAAAALKLLLFTGGRLREILHCRWDEVDFEQKVIRKPSTKTGKREIVLNDDALSVLNSLRRVSKYIFPGSVPDHPRYDLKDPWDKVREKANLKDMRIHDLRHSFASALVRRNVDLFQVGKLLGHKQPNTTARYAHLANDTLRAVANLVNYSSPK
jgi:integrase